jgi:hypothetical protein
MNMVMETIDPQQQEQIPHGDSGTKSPKVNSIQPFPHGIGSTLQRVKNPP